MRKQTTILAAFAAALFMITQLASCKCSDTPIEGDGQQAIKQQITERVEYMVSLEKRGVANLGETIFTNSLKELYAKALKYQYMTGYNFFTFEGKVFDVCNMDSTKRVVSVKEVEIVDDNNAKAMMNYKDEPCYNINYTLLLKKEGGEWKIDDVIWEDRKDNSMPMRERLEAEEFIAGIQSAVKEADAQEVLSIMFDNPPKYDNEASIYYKNSAAVREHIENVKTIYESFKKNSGYKQEYDNKLEEYIAEIKQEAHNHGLEI